MLALAREAGDEIVLRLMTREPWRSHGRALTTRESRVQLMLTSTQIPAPRSLALDAEGLECGHSAHLMSLVPGGSAMTAPTQPHWGLSLTCSAPSPCRPADDRGARVPVMGLGGQVRSASVSQRPVPVGRRLPTAAQRTASPQPCFIHRDFRPRNLLWSEGRVGGVVGWVETSIGPAWLDVTHCRG